MRPLRILAGLVWIISLLPFQAAAQADDARRATTTLSRAGVVIGAGSDIPVAHLGIPMELEQLVATGLSPPHEALTAATGTAAAILGTDQVGTLGPGALADLVVLDADPLADIRNVHRVRAVIRGGRVVDRNRLHAGAPRP